jgi:hypothetical protein
MIVNLHIERLILEGLPVESAQGRAVRTAVERELALLLGAGGLAGDLRSGGAFPEGRSGAIRLARGPRPARLGRQIADAVYRSVGKTQ